MSYRNDVMEELHALKREAGHVLTTGAEEWRRISNQKAQTVAAELLQSISSPFRSGRQRIGRGRSSGTACGAPLTLRAGRL